jgi:hypothetical protein
MDIRQHAIGERSISISITSILEKQSRVPALGASDNDVSAGIRFEGIHATRRPVAESGKRSALASGVRPRETADICV